jgi:hypothetical protein
MDKLLIVEYERIKDEQKARIGFRDNLLYVTLAAMAAVIAATINAHAHAWPLLLLPPVSAVLGWTYLVNDEKVSAAGRYIRTELAPRLAAMIPGNEPVFGWESVHRTDSRRRSRKLMQLAVDLLTYCVAPLSALVVYWVSGPWNAALLTVSVAEAIVVLILGIELCRYADL